MFPTLLSLKAHNWLLAHRIKCRMPWRFGTQYAIHNGSDKHPLCVLFSFADIRFAGSPHSHTADPFPQQRRHLQRENQALRHSDAFPWLWGRIGRRSSWPRILPNPFHKALTEIRPGTGTRDLCPVSDLRCWFALTLVGHKPIPMCSSWFQSFGLVRICTNLSQHQLHECHWHGTITGSDGSCRR